MKQAKTFFTLFFSIVLLGVQPLHAMCMASMPMMEKECLCKMAERRRREEAEREGRRVVRERENKFINDLFISHTNLNEDVGGCKPLERVCRLKSIIALLRHGADPALCTRSPLIRSLFYYMHRKYRKPESLFLGTRKLKRKEEYVRRATKVFACFDWLLKAGANANQEMREMLPLQRIVYLDRNDYFSYINVNSFLKLLIWHGANPHKVETQMGRTVCNYAFSVGHFPAFSYIKQERQKYEAVCQLLESNQDKNSRLSLLPLEILNEIIRYVKQGPFELPAETRRAEVARPIPAVPEPRDVPVKDSKSSNSAGMIADESPQARQQRPVSSRRDEIEHSRSGSRLAKILQLTENDREWPAKWRYIFGAKVLVFTAASGISYWAYKKWQKHKKEREKRRQELWDQYHRRRIAY